MKMRIAITFLVFISLGAYAQKKNYDLFDVYKRGIFSPEYISEFNSTPDGKYYTESENNGISYKIMKYSFADPNFEEVLFDGIKFDNSNFVSYKLSQDQKSILLFSDPQKIYRHSSAYMVYFYDISSQKLEKIGEDRVLHASVSPDNKYISFVRDNNMFLYDLLSHEEKQITTDGKVNEIINGNCDWVYEEEFGFTQAYQWSENAQYIAYYKFDESEVHEFTMQYYRGLYPDNYTFRYPKAGEDNSKVSMWLYDLKTGNSKKVGLPTEEELYIPRIFWNHDNQLAIMTLNRLQNNKRILLYSPESSKLKKVYDESSDTYLDVGNDLIFLKDNSFLICSDKSGYNHIQHVSCDGKKVKALTKGSWEVREVFGVSTDEKHVYYTAGKSSPTVNQVYSNEISKKKDKLLTPEEGWHEVSFSASMDYFLDEYSSTEHPSIYVLKNSQGQKVRELEDNADFLATYNDYAHGSSEFMKMKLSSGEFDAILMKPEDFDPSKKYPVLFYQYSGPGSQSVKNSFFLSSHFLHKVLLQKGYLIFIMDPRGTGGRGRDFQKQTYRQLGKYESEDLIEAAKELSKESFVDEERIGIWGWSYGGYMSSICLMKGAEIFSTAIAVAPVSNWRYYDNIYTERYMGLPQDNEEGYDDNSPSSMVAGLEGNFLIIHGLADDNVHFQNTAMLVDAMIAANKKFDSEFYPNQAHGMGSGRFHMYERIVDFLEQNL